MRSVGLAIALVTGPMRSVRAWRRGLRQRNLYRLAPDKRLSLDLAEARRYVGC